MPTLEGLLQVRPRDVAVELDKELTIARALTAGKPLASYIGWTGQGNLGDEALLDAHQHLFPHWSVVPYRPDRLVSTARRIDPRLPQFHAGFLGGGTLINQSDVWLRRIRDLQRRNLPVMCLGGGVTPPEFLHSFEHTSLTDWIPVLRTLAFVGVRGPLSQATLADAGLEVEVTGDPALALAPESAPPAADNAALIGLNVGVGPKTLMHGDPVAFVDAMTDTVRALLGSGFRVRMLPVCAEDVPACQQIQSRVGHAGIELVRAYQSWDAYTDQVRDCSAFVGQKLHATVAAITQRVPSLMIEYQPKCLDFMASIGQEHNTVRTDEVGADTADRIIALQLNGATIRQQLDGQVRRLRARQHQLAAELGQL